MVEVKYKNKQHDKDTMITLRASWIDQSFQHEHGFKKQGFFEVTAVMFNGVNIPLDILDSKFLEGLDDYANK